MRPPLLKLFIANYSVLQYFFFLLPYQPTHFHEKDDGKQNILYWDGLSSYFDSVLCLCTDKFTSTWRSILCIQLLLSCMVAGQLVFDGSLSSWALVCQFFDDLSMCHRYGIPPFCSRHYKSCGRYKNKCMSKNGIRACCILFTQLCVHQGNY